MSFGRYNGPQRPRLTLLDKQSSAPAEIVFQFKPINFTENQAANWASSSSLGRDNPILQYNSGDQVVYEFEAQFWAETEADAIETIIEALRNARRRDDNLGRPPLWNFNWGSIISDNVVVKSVGDIRYSDVRPDGTARGANCRITLWKYEQTDIILTDPNKPLPSTYYRPAKVGEIWEQVALREYGDPLLGDALRRMNPQLHVPGDKPATVLALLPVSRFQGIAIEPYSIPLQRTTAGIAARKAMWDKRSQSRGSAIVLL